MKEFETPNGKKIVLVQEPNSVRVMFSPGGELPEELKGKYTSAFFAERDVLAYLAKQETKAERGKGPK